MGPRGRLRVVVELRGGRGRFGVRVWVKELRYFVFIFETSVGGAEVRGGGFTLPLDLLPRGDMISGGLFLTWKVVG
jgi:hypothetical protein